MNPAIYCTKIAECRPADWEAIGTVTLIVLAIMGIAALVDHFTKK